MLELVADADRTERLQQQMNVLADVARVFTRAESMHEVLEGVISAINSATGFLSSLDLLDTRGRIVMRSTAASRFTGTPLYEAWLRLTRGPDPVRKMIVENHQPVLLPDLQNDPRISEEAREFYRRSSIVSAATFPLLFQDEVVGLLRVGSLKPTSFDPPTVDLLRNLALQAAVVVKGVQLWKELQRSRRKTERYAAKLQSRNQELLNEISERQRAEEALREQVRRDPLTGALNHGAIVDELRTLISLSEDGSSHAVAMIDVDGLKAINDTYGHQVGDAVLRAVAGALSRDGALLGRYGGDEFVALLPGADRGAAERYRQGVLAALADVDLRDPETGARVAIVVSVGLAIYPTEAGRIEDLIKLADGAMYAWRRQRPVVLAGKSLSRPLGGDRAAEMVGQIVPLLTSPGDLNDKLRLVAHRLSVGGGYEAVNFQLFSDPSEVPTGQNTFAKVADEVVEAWNRAQRQARDVPMRRILERTHRPIVVDSPQNDRRLTDKQRELLRAAGLRSALVAPMIWQNELIGHVAVASRRKAAFGPPDAEFLMAVAAQVTAIVRLATLVDELQSTSTRLVQAQTETVMMLAAAAEAHDHTTGPHLQNVRAVTKALAGEFGDSAGDASELGLAAVLHDIGKIRVPDIVLSTAGQLTDEEWELMKQHTVWGQEFLAGRPGFELAAAIARSHHERWDGGGYPDGLAGEAIPEAATIVAVADAFDAMTSDRPYKAARSVAAAVQEIMACSGGQFSPRAVQALVRLQSRKGMPRLRREPSDKLAA
jgi:diguanylate cyclase (GGDEF)-like protein